MQLEVTNSWMCIPVKWQRNVIEDIRQYTEKSDGMEKSNNKSSNPVWKAADVSNNLILNEWIRMKDLHDSTD